MPLCPRKVNGEAMNFFRIGTPVPAGGLACMSERSICAKWLAMIGNADEKRFESGRQHRTAPACAANDVVASADRVAAGADPGRRWPSAVMLALLTIAAEVPAQSPFEVERERMLTEIDVLMQATGGETGRSHLSPRVRKALADVPRHRFVPPAQRDSAYANRSLPIGEGQTVSEPFIVALMTELLDSGPHDRVLEVGTGSGYQTAVLAECAGRVFTIEIVRSLGERAASVLSGLGYRNIEFRIGDGYRGWPEEAPFDRIIVTAAPDHVPQPLIDQLRPGGRMVIPVGPQGLEQDLLLVSKQLDGRTVTQAKIAVRFVPLVHGQDSR
jgi:protein-L-isoaspartate(D-aspartate) O-methyltransferase